ncbi:MAG: hypothetical protein LBQ55_02395 [Treponema sp.]|jgi:hypothetical protein|nr:hypothetical protein [Treponema sp.]
MMKIKDVKFNAKKLILWLFVFSPVMVHSQYLVPGDIDILVKGWDTINTAFSGADENTQAWESYNEQGTAITILFGGAMEAAGGFSEYDDGDGDLSDDNTAYLENLKLHFNEFLNCKVPKNLEESFRSIGWKKDGHKKMFTILFGSMMLIVNEELANEGGNMSAGQFADVFGVFNSSDLEIIQTHLEEIKHLITS